jgi:hypothetical protein
VSELRGERIAVLKQRAFYQGWEKKNVAEALRKTYFKALRWKQKSLSIEANVRKAR